MVTAEPTSEAAAGVRAFPMSVGNATVAMEDIVPPESPLDPAHKSGHHVSDGPCWCGDLHYYEAPATEAAGEEEA